MDQERTEPGARIAAATSPDGTLVLTIGGRLDSETVGGLWRDATAAFERTRPPRVAVDAGAIEYLDGAGASLLAELKRRAGGALEVRGLSAGLSPLLEIYDATKLAKPEVKEPPLGFVEQLGKGMVGLWENIRFQIAFVGELTVALFAALRRPRQVRWKDYFIVCERAGVDAFPIIALIGFLLGLILAFQTAVPMKQYGAEIFVADMVAVSMLRELGPLMTAILLAGRSGSAFAAELGTMKVNEELDALSTMALDPVRFLATTRVLAAVVMTPLLSVFLSFFALAGAAVVILGMGYPIITYWERVVSAVSLIGYLSGVLMAFVFGLLVASVGCLRGIQTGKGAQAVGASTTSAVVSGIILIAVADAVFSIIQFALDI